MVKTIMTAFGIGQGNQFKEIIEEEAGNRDAAGNS